MISIEHHKPTDIITIKIEGPVTSSEIMKFMAKLGKKFNGKQKLYVLSDYSKGSIKANPGYFVIGMNNVKEVFHEFLASFENFYNSYVLNEADESTTLIIKQFTNLLKEVDGYFPKIFYNHEDAENWLKQKQQEE